MSLRPFSDSLVAARPRIQPMVEGMVFEAPWDGFGATLKDTLAQGTGHGGEG